MEKITIVMSFALVILFAPLTYGSGWTSGEVQQSVEIQQSIDEDLRHVLEQIQREIGCTSQIDILDLQYTEGHLIIDLSQEIQCYGGGNAIEYSVIQHLLDWSFSDEVVERVTLLVEGSTHGFPEGTQIIACSRAHYEKYYMERRE